MFPSCPGRDAGCGTQPGVTAGKRAEPDREGVVVSGGLKRRYRLHVPAGEMDPSTPIPLIVALHGRYTNGHTLRRETGFDEIADRKRFLVVYPDGFKRSWADGRGITPADRRRVNDVEFLNLLIRGLRYKFPIDDRRIFVVGYSNGGFMAQRWAVETPGRLAAMAVVSASISGATAREITPLNAVPVLFMHGTGDQIIPYGGRKAAGGKAVLPVETAVKLWAAANGCGTIPDRKDALGRGGDRRLCILIYGSPDKTRQVRLYRIPGGDHAWPGSGCAGDAGHPAAMRAAEEIWRFFSRVAP